MAIPGLDPEKCRERNLADALRGVHAAPVRFSGGSGPPPPPDGATVFGASGTLPTDPEEAVARINASNGATGPDALTPGDVYLHYPEVGSQRFVGKYNLHLGISTLKNIKRAGDEGISFMNSHRTGGFSEPCELPYGRSFAGRFETLTDASTGARMSRALMGVYMVKGVRPNGANGPSTDDLDRMIRARTLQDVSLGFVPGGTCVCDVCGADLSALDEDGEDYLCPHVPGTHRAMSAEQVRAQKDRGVPGGVASFTLEDGDVNEVSAVYDGALPGAGFRKARRLARKSKFSPGELAEAQEAFAPVLSGAALAGPFGTPPTQARPKAAPKPKGPSMKVTPAQILAEWAAMGSPADVDLAEIGRRLEANSSGPRPAPTPEPPPPPAPNPAPRPPAAPSTSASGPAPNESEALRLQVQGLQEQLKAMTDQTQADRAADQERTDRMQAEAFVALHAGPSSRRIVPAEKTTVLNQYIQAAKDDRSSPARLSFFKDGTIQTGTRLEALTASIAARVPHQFATEAVSGAGPRPPAQPSYDLGANGAADKPLGQGLYEAAVKFAERKNKKQDRARERSGR